MASNKNQHYVPQCYLKNFATDESKAAICLYNLDRKKLIKNAPIKNQCSKDYFYGEDLVLEKALQPIEGKFSELVRTIAKSNYVLKETDKLFFKNFWLLQYLRTDAASRRAVELSEGIGEAVGETDFKLEIKTAVQESMRTYHIVQDIVRDLKVCLFKNYTKTNFIISDDPAVLTNRWFLQDKRAKHESFGLGAAGCLFILPLTPKLLMMAYDGDVYSVSKTKGWVSIKNTSDIDAFNYLQLINCRANLYTENSGSFEYLEVLHEMVEDVKPEHKHRIKYSVLDNDNDIVSMKRFRVVESYESEEHTEALIHCQAIHVAPPIWPKVINWRNKGFVMTNGTGIGFVRSSIAKKYATNDFYKLPVLDN